MFLIRNLLRLLKLIFMKKTTFFIALLFCLTFTGIQAQNPLYKNGISFKALFMDYQSQNDGNISAFRDYHHGLEFGYLQNIQPNINLVVPVKIGVVRSHNLEANNSFHKTVYGIDAQLQYQQYKPNTKLTPYVMSGLGGVMETGGSFNLQIPLGVGLNFKAAPNAYINWQSEYRLSLSDGRNNLQHGLGFVYLINSRGDIEEIEEEELKPIDEMMLEETVMEDSDGDGIRNDLDLCPQSAGSKELNGCPDSDSDGIADYKDACPSTPGLRTFRGCPDSDSDGISDNEDECPNMPGKITNKGCPDNDDDNDGVPNELDKCPDYAGSPNNNGCPEVSRPAQPNNTLVVDSDGDGIIDSEDNCPYSAGIRAYRGCPDTDGDGIDDSRDACPGESGSVANNGCPDVAKEDRDILELAMRAVQFDTGKSTLKSESYRVLNQISDIMFKYPNFKLAIEGHTDNTGNAGTNQSLSERRAKSCYEYILKRGVPLSQVSFHGYGEAKPISNNDTLRGRALNRRVEFNLMPQ